MHAARPPRTKTLILCLALSTTHPAFAQPQPHTTPHSSTEKAPARLPFRGTSLTWDHALTAGAFGIGRNDIDPLFARYTQGLGLTLNWFFIDPTDPEGNERSYSLRAASAFGFDIELTKNPEIRTQHTPELRDIPLSLILDKTLWRSPDKEWALTSVFNASFAFPTSRQSSNQGIYFAASPRASLFFQIPILGQQSEIFKSVQLGLSIRYDQRFSRAPIHADPALLRPRISPTGQSIYSDQVSGGPIDSNGPRLAGSFFMSPKIPGGGDLQLFVSTGMQYLLDQPEGDTNTCDIIVADECVDIEEQERPAIPRLRISMSAAVSYFPMPDFGFSLGYITGSSQVREGQEPPSIFANPAAVFTASFIFAPDALIERLIGPARDEPVVYFGQDTPSTRLSPLPPAFHRSF
jgi:hypothetical protein